MDLQNLTTKQKMMILAVVVSAAAIYFAFSNFQNFSGSISENNIPSSGKEVSEEQETKRERRYYEITGQVNSPGVYEAEGQMMVIELISLAGGLTDTADLYTIHKDISLSALVEDRQKVYIPGIFERTASMSASQINTANTGGAQTSGKISINNATAGELESLPDIGPATSAKIIAARPFSAVEDLKKVQGIGDKTYNNIVSLISL